MEEQIKKLVCELKHLLEEKDILVITYNPKNPEGIKEADCNFLRFLFDKVKFVFPLLILSGPGGDLVPGIIFPELINKYVGNYKVYIPRICGSALCYTIFKAKELLIGKNTEITQIDPSFEYQGEELRAIKHIHSVNDDLKNKARKVFDLAQTHIKKLSIPPSIFKFKIMQPNEFQHIEFITSNFMNKKDHETPITMSELKELEMNIKKIENPAIDKIANDLVMICQDFTIKNDVRVIFVSSTPFILEKEEGCFICPLK